VSGASSCIPLSPWARTKPNRLALPPRLMLQMLQMLGNSSDGCRGRPRRRIRHRCTERVNSRNGYRQRNFDTRARMLDVAIPALCQSSHFPDWLLKRRAEAALTSVVATYYLLGFSTSRKEKLVESLGITRLPKSQVSNMDRDLDEQVEAFRTRACIRSPPMRSC
jgi:hypothetical protein